MPRENGLDLYKRLKNSAQFTHAQYVLYSTTINEKLRRLAQMAGISKYLVKTADLRALVEELRKILFGRNSD
jgi:DNA-binding NarL/FixJ family response regulator